MYASHKNSTTCLPCIRGRHQATIGSRSCSECARGKYSNSAAETCSDCAMGKFHDSVGSDRDAEHLFCKECEKGRYADKVGMTICRLCEAGRYDDDGTDGSARCIDCPFGYSQDLMEQSECKKCKIGTVVAKTGSRECLRCSSGKVADASTHQCVGCLPGTFRGDGDVTDEDGGCLTCPAGFSAASSSQSFCSACVAGKFAGANSSTQCDQCDTGMHQPEKRTTSCLPCLGGLVSNIERTRCERPDWKIPSDCQLGEYLDDYAASRSNWKCRSCPSGAECNNIPTSRSHIRHRAGFWNVTWSNATHVPWSPFAECPRKDTCAAAVDECQANSTGVLCSKCKEGFFQTSNSGCAPCDQNTAPDKIIAAVAVVLILSIFWRVIRPRIRRLRRKYGAAWRDVLRILTINLTFAQINSSLPDLIQVPWPSNYLKFLDDLTFVNFDVFGLLGVSCFGVRDYQSRILLVCAVPAIIVLYQFISYRVAAKHMRGLREGSKRYRAVQRHVVEHLFDVTDRDASGIVSFEEFLMLMKSMLESIHHDDTLASKARKLMLRLGASSSLELSRQEFIEQSIIRETHEKGLFSYHRTIRAKMRHVRANYFSFTFVIMFVLHAPVSNRLFQYFNCRDMTHGLQESKHLLHADLSVVCWHDAHFAFAYGVVLPILLLFTFSLPFSISAFLCYNRRQL